MPTQQHDHGHQQDGLKLGFDLALGGSLLSLELLFGALSLLSGLSPSPLELIDELLLGGVAPAAEHLHRLIVGGQRLRLVKERLRVDG